MYYKIEAIREDLQDHYKRKITTEEIFDREPVIPYTCDEFQKLIAFISNAENEVSNGLKSDDHEEAIEALSEVEYYLSGVAERVEKLNDEVDLIRQWGQSWKDLTKELIENQHIDVSQYSNLYYGMKEKE